MNYRVIFYKDVKGNTPVEDYLFSLPKAEQDKCLAFIKRITEEGPHLRRPTADYLGGKSKLYELRPGRHRYLYYFHDKTVVLLHAFLKKTSEIPVEDIDEAEYRKEICEVLFAHGRITVE